MNESREPGNSKPHKARESRPVVVEVRRILLAVWEMYDLREMFVPFFCVCCWCGELGFPRVLVFGIMNRYSGRSGSSRWIDFGVRFGSTMGTTVPSSFPLENAEYD